MFETEGKFLLVQGMVGGATYLNIVFFQQAQPKVTLKNLGVTSSKLNKSKLKKRKKKQI